MKQHLLLFSVLVALGFNGCKKDSNDPTIDFGPNEGVTYRDFMNYPQGQNDPSDWTLDSNWNNQEKILFDDLGVDVNSTASGNVRNISFFPNPVETEGILACQSPVSGLSIKFVFVDRKYKVLNTVTNSLNSTGYYNFSFEFTDSKFKKGEIYRLYYVFYQGQTLYYKGHGDIKIAK